MSASCRNCHYFALLESVCRRYPPTAMVFHANRGEIGSMFPPAKPDGWCGEHKVTQDNRTEASEAQQ